MLYYIIRVWEGETPVPFGPFISEPMRNQRMDKMTKLNGSRNHKFYGINIRKSDGTIEVNSIEVTDDPETQMMYKLSKYI